MDRFILLDLYGDTVAHKHPQLKQSVDQQSDYTFYVLTALFFFF